MHRGPLSAHLSSAATAHEGGSAAKASRLRWSNSLTLGEPVTSSHNSSSSGSSSQNSSDRRAGQSHNGGVSGALCAQHTAASMQTGRTSLLRHYQETCSQHSSQR